MKKHLLTFSLASAMFLANFAVAQENKISEPAWLRNNLPDKVVAYGRVPSIWGLLSAPNGRALDKALQDPSHQKIIGLLREAFSDGKILKERGLNTESILANISLLFGDMDGPLEIAVLSNSESFAPDNKIIATARFNFKDIESLNKKIKAAMQYLDLGVMMNEDGSIIEEESFSSKLIFNADGIATMGPNALFYYDVKIQRLYILSSMVEAINADNIGETLTLFSQPTTHIMHDLEKQIDSSGQGSFVWISLKSLGPIMASVIPNEPEFALLKDLVSKLDALAFGMGTSEDGHGQLRFRVQTPDAKILQYLAASEFKIDLKSAGNPSSVSTLMLPNAQRIQAFQQDLKINFGEDAEIFYQENIAKKLSFLNLESHEILKLISSELISFNDQNGSFMALKLTDAPKFSAELAKLSEKYNWKQSLLADQVQHLIIPNYIREYLQKDNINIKDKGSYALAMLMFTRKNSHFYYSVEGNWLVFADVPQSLYDRAHSNLDTNINDWLLNQQGYNSGQVFLGSTMNLENIQRSLYYVYIDFLQSLIDELELDVSIADLPSSNAIKLPKESRLSMSLDILPQQLGFTLAYEQFPFEVLLSGNSATITFATVGILSAITIPRYQDYIIKTQVTRVMGETRFLRSPVETCINDGILNLGLVSSEKLKNCDPDLVGSNLIEGNTYGQPAFAKPSAGKGYPQIKINQDQTAVISAKFGHEAHAILNNEGLAVQWQRDNIGNWQCFVGSVTQENSLALLRPSNYYKIIKYIPRGCTLVDK